MSFIVEDRPEDIVLDDIYIASMSGIQKNQTSLHFTRHQAELRRFESPRKSRSHVHACA